MSETVYPEFKVGDRVRLAAYLYPETPIKYGTILSRGRLTDAGRRYRVHITTQLDSHFATRLYARDLELITRQEVITDIASALVAAIVATCTEEHIPIAELDALDVRHSFIEGQEILAGDNTADFRAAWQDGGELAIEFDRLWCEAQAKLQAEG